MFIVGIGEKQHVSAFQAFAYIIENGFPQILGFLADNVEVTEIFNPFLQSRIFAAVNGFELFHELSEVLLFFTGCGFGIGNQRLQDMKQTVGIFQKRPCVHAVAVVIGFVTVLF